MTKFFNYLHIVSAYLLCIWLGQTILIDLFLAPKIFQIIPDFFLAGNVAVAIFQKMNVIELLISGFCFSSTTLLLTKNSKYKWPFLFGVLLIAIVCFYNFYLTEKIKMLADLWQYSEMTQTNSLENGFDVQQEHQFYHRIYVATDVVKIILISIQIFLLTKIKINYDTSKD
jgi:hypothetical protein